MLSARDDPRMSDANTCMWDPLRRRFIAFTKRHLISPRTLGDMGTWVRARGISFSDDFEHWTPPVTCLVPDAQDPRDMQFYNQSAWATEGMYVGLLEAYHASYRDPEMAYKRDLQLISSRDGELWWRAADRQVFLPPGAEGEWDSHLLDLNAAPPTLIGDELWFFYGGRDYPHEQHPEFWPSDRPRRAAIGLATLRREGYVSLDAGVEPGTVTTRPIRFAEGKRLFVNADARGGSIAVEVCRVNVSEARPGLPRGIKYRVEDALPGWGRDDAVPITEDATRLPVRWRGGDALPERDWFSLRFVLRNASLYGFWAE